MDTIYNQRLDTSAEQGVFPDGISRAIREAAQTECLGDNIEINTLDLRLQNDHVIETVGPPTFCIAVFLEGYGQLSIDNGPTLDIKPGMTVVFHAPVSAKGRTLFLGDHRLHCLDMRFSLDYLCSFGIDSLTRLIPMFQHNCSVADLMMLARPTSTRLMSIAKEIMHCSMTGLARNVFLQAKALEALSQVLAVIEQPDSNQPKLSKIDQIKVQQAIQLIDQDYQSPWTISRLAREVGLNERKLKTGFHRLVQSTVHNYLEETRLNEAKTLLAQGSKVTDVAMAVGYANPSHFAKRFKQRFDIAPSQWNLRQE